MKNASRRHGGEPADEVLLAAKRGSPQAFAELIGRYDRRLRSLAFRLMEDREAMQDVMQDAYLAAFRGLPAFRGESALQTWLFRIVYTTCLRHLARRRDDLTMVDYERMSSSSASDPADAVALRQDVVAALAGLPREQRAAVLLIDGEGFSYREAGQVLDVPPGTIASRLSHGRAALRLVLGLQGGEVSGDGS